MTMVFPDFSDLPAALRSAAEEGWRQYLEAVDRCGTTVPQDERVSAQVPKVWSVSRFVAEQCVRDPAMWADLVDSGDLGSTDRAKKYVRQLNALTESAVEFTDLQRSLRRFRNREMVRIAWRDITGWASLEETLGDLSLLAEACIQAALQWLFERACRRYGTPRCPDGQPQLPVVLAMGKLGAWELNFSSDIDLIFAFEHDGELEDKRATSYQEFYLRLCRDLVKALQAQTEDGFVFRVDTRLRPFGDSGPLVLNFDAMDIYYQSQARAWERYAMIKARPVAGDPDAGERLMQMLEPFVYRRYLDYRALGALRELKRKIMEELKRRDRLEDIKLGPGGIREIEFIAQVFQLIRGGREIGLRDQRLRVILKRLTELDLLPPEESETLLASYRFLRLVENRLQEYNDQQTQQLPSDDVGRLRLAVSMDAPDWTTFQNQLQEVRGQVQTLFEEVFALPETAEAESESARIWRGAEDEDLLQELLAKQGYGDSEGVWQQLREFRRSRPVRLLTSQAATELDRLMPVLIETVAQGENPDRTLRRLLALLEAIASRSAYLTLLVENPGALNQLVRLAAASPWVANHLAQYPMLLDELIDPNTLYAPLTRDQLETAIDHRLAGLDLDDDEGLLNALRHFKQAHVLRVAAADIANAIPTRVVSDYLTDIAEVVLERSVAIAWKQVTAKYGLPPGEGDRPRDFVVIGYGKLGGIELGYGSDLDLVFLYRGEAEAVTSGPRAIPCAQFYIRLGQRLIHLLTTPMLSGVLYEIDMRLRPSGNAGLLVTGLGAFERYQRESAWTWEHQALVRARPVAGDFELGKAFERVRLEVLGRERELGKLRQEVLDMRDKMRAHLNRSDSGRFDLKHGPGGVVDIEFIVQFGCLAHAHRRPEAFRHPDNLRLLDALAEIGWLGDDQKRFLQETYLGYRTRLHRFALQEQSGLVPADAFREERTEVVRLWRRLIENSAGEK
ncbi:MAG: bifunctional [glutamate--ammonia ligase]-adenylyl-L-tyrosine phosphorylase/[glutamate--ammonia-ligase] adenylyltransferase [Methylohalobius sp. ZOD2]